MFPCSVLLLSMLVFQSQAGSLPRGEEKPYYSLEEAEYHFEQFISEYNKQYSNEEEKNYRFNVFKETLKKINEDNANTESVFGVNMFADMTEEEFKPLHSGLRPNKFAGGVNSCRPVVFRANVSAPYTLDWRTKGVVSRVKNQHTCRSCWAFSTTGNLESQYAIKHGQMVDLSEQQLVDCDNNDHGCNGGYQTSAFVWLSQNGGSVSEASYPYTGVQQPCQRGKRGIVQVLGCNIYHIRSEEQIKDILASVGPLAVGIDSRYMKQYHGNIFLGCPPNPLIDHAVLLVGYGYSGNQPYWIVKNSWGPQWGENGYFRLPLGVNACGIASSIITSGMVA